jgi:hypothetical protein
VPQVVAWGPEFNPKYCTGEKTKKRIMGTIQREKCGNLKRLLSQMKWAHDWPDFLL